MAQSGVFRLLLGDPRFDQIFTATDVLKERLRQIRQKRQADGLQVPQATFTDLGKHHIVHIRAAYRPFVNVASEYIRVKANGDSAALSAGSGGVAEFKLPTHGQFTSDMVFHVRFQAVGTESPTIGVGADASPRYRYCAYPGIRMFRRVAFQSDQTVIDDYEADEVSFVNKFTIPGDRRQAWDRGNGQAGLRTAEFFNNNGYSGVLSYREGMQTPKYYHGAQDLWVPLHFWMCDDASHALLNDLVPNTQRLITAELAPLEQIVQAVDQNSGEVVPLPLDRLTVQVDLYVNNLFIDPEIYDLFAARIGFSLIRVHRRQKKVLNQQVQSIKLDQLKYPLEYMYAGFRDLNNLADFDHWHLFGRARTRTDATSLLAPAAIWNSALSVCQIVCRSAKEVDTLDPVVENLKLTAHGIDLFPSALPASFFNTYLPQRYFNSTGAVSPLDSSAFLATFCLYPGTYEPSGYYNMSAGRELYLSYRSESIDHSAPAELVVSASTLNFLVRKGDSISLRYAI